MRITLNISKSLEENASLYFERAKKAKKKLEGAREAVERLKRQVEDLKEKEDILIEEEEQKKLPQRKKHWFEKFRWFRSSEGFLCIGGRDATSNEVLIKKHTDPDDIVFHTDMAGSPFFVIKTEDKRPGQITMEECASATATYSRAWRSGLGTLDVFHVDPSQVTKQTQAGEYMGKGAFMIRGKTTYLHPRVECRVGITDDSLIMGGPPSAIEKNTIKSIKIIQGKKKPGEIAKFIKKDLSGGDLDEIIRALPAGGMEIGKN